MGQRTNKAAEGLECQVLYCLGTNTETGWSGKELRQT